jgi:hypothetical protein
MGLNLRDELLTAFRRGWRRMTLGALGYAFLQTVLLYLCLAMLGSPIPPLAVFAAYATGSALTLVPITPGGVGLSEAGSAALLVTFGATASTAAAGVLLFSTFTRFLAIPFGTACATMWWCRRQPDQIEADLPSACSTHEAETPRAVPLASAVQPMT